MPSHDSTLDDIKDRIDIVDLISEYVNLKKAGQNWKGLCPFHTEKTPSFTVSPAKQIFHCFGCGTGGDIFTFLVRYESLTFPEALSILAKRAGVTLKTSRQSPVKAGEKETLLNMHKDALDFFRQNLAKNAKAAGYLKERGVDENIRQLFSLGYALNSWNALLNYLTRKGYKTDAIKKAGLASQGNKGMYDTFRDRIIFPIYDLKGDVVAFGGRSIDGSEPKYLNSPETLIFNKRKVLYGLNRAKESIKDTGYALFMEGYLDVITSHVHGFANAVAPLGTAFTPEQGKLIKRFVEDVIIVFDSDQAGAKAAKKAADILLESGLGVSVLAFPEGDDPDSFLRKKGAEAFSKLLEAPLSIVDFIMMQKGDRRLKAREAIETISRVPDKILAGEYIRTLSETLNVKESLVLEQLKKVRVRSSGGHGTEAPQTRPRPRPKPLDEVYIIKFLMQLPEQAEEVTKMISSEDITDPVIRSVFRRIKEDRVEFNQLISECEGEEKDFLTVVSFMDDFEDPERVLNDCLKHLTDNRRRVLLRELQGKIKEAESKKDFKMLKQLQIEQQKLMKPT